jgi:hypothetical protein
VAERLLCKHLLCKCEALNSNPSPIKNKTTKTQKTKQKHKQHILFYLILIKNPMM